MQKIFAAKCTADAAAPPRARHAVLRSMAGAQAEPYSNRMPTHCNRDPFNETGSAPRQETDL